MSDFQLAQINIAKAKDELTSETMSKFVARLDEINAIADRSPGFVWRLQTEEGDATSIRAFNDSHMIVNMSVWDSIESLRDFVYKSLHVDLIRDRESWFDKILEAHQVLWWIPKNHVPTVEEGKERLGFFQQHGSSERAFSFAKPFSRP